jgi:hypothetical protein
MGELGAVVQGLREEGSEPYSVELEERVQTPRADTNHVTQLPKLPENDKKNPQTLIT